MCYDTSLWWVRALAGSGGGGIGVSLSNPNEAGVQSVSHGFGYDYSFVYVPTVGVVHSTFNPNATTTTAIAGAGPLLRDVPQGSLIAAVSQACQASCLKAATAFYSCYCPCFKLKLQADAVSWASNIKCYV